MNAVQGSGEGGEARQPSKNIQCVSSLFFHKLFLKLFKTRTNALGSEHYFINFPLKKKIPLNDLHGLFLCLCLCNISSLKS